MFNKNILFLFAIASLILPACDFGSKEDKIKPSQEGELMSKTVFTFFGPPGSGKGTLAQMCKEELNFKILSTGNLCRIAMNKNDERSKQITQALKEGKLAPDELIAEMVEEWLEAETNKDDNSIILDGYPRTLKQADLLLTMLKSKFPEYKFRVLSITVPDEEIIERMTSRLICENKKCQATYSIKFLKDPNKLICEKCNAKLIKRPDDQEEIVRERLDVHAKHSNEVLNFYRQKGILIEELNVSKITIDEMFEKFKKML